MLPLLAQSSEIINKGSEYGPLGWVLGIVVIGAAGAAIWWARTVYPKSAERDERLVKAVETLCTSTTLLQTAVTDTHSNTAATQYNVGKLILLYRTKIDILQKLAEAAGVELRTEIGIMKGILADIEQKDKNRV